MEVITLGPKDFIKGESLSDWISDRGFSPDSYGLNLTKKRGLLYFAEAGTDRTQSVLTGNIVCAGYDFNISGNDAYFLDDEGAFYTYLGTTLTKRQTVAADTFALGTSDLLQFGLVTYATGQGRIQALTASNLTGLTDSFWSGLDNNYRHPLERVEDKVYVGNKNVVGTITNVTTTTAAEITLPTDINITSLRKHPDGRTLLAFCGLTTNISHTLGLGGRVYYIDTVLKKWTREVELDVQVEGSRVSGGVIYVTYGQNVGYFDGDGVKFLKRLSTSTTTYSHNLVPMEDKLLVRDGLDVLAFGDLGAGRVWWRIFRNTVNSENINNIFYKGSDTLLVGFGNGAGGGFLYEINYANVGLSGVLRSNRYVFDREAVIRRIEIIHETTNSAGITRFTITNLTPGDIQTTLMDRTYVNESVNVTREELDVRVDVLEFILTMQNDDIGFMLIRIYWEPIEK